MAMHRTRICASALVLALILAELCPGGEEAPESPAASADAPTILTGLSSRPVGIRFFPDAKRLVAVEIDTKTNVWDLGTGRSTASHKAGTGYYRAMELDPTGTLLAVARMESGAPGEVTVFDASRLTVRYTSRPRASGLSFSPDGKSLSIVRSGGLYTYDSATGQKLASVETKLPFDRATSVAFSRTRLSLAIVFWQVDGGWVALWTPSTTDKPRALTGYVARTYVTAYSPKADMLLVGACQEMNQRHPDDHDAALSLFDPVRGVRTAVLQEQPLDVIAVAFSNDGQRLVSANRRGAVNVWDVANRRITEALAGPRDWQITCLAFSPDDRLLAAGAGWKREGGGWGGGGQVLVWKVK